MADLKTDYVDDVLDTDVNETRIFNIVDSDGNVVAENVHFVDNTTYTTTGDSYGATEVNEQNEVINQINTDLSEVTAYSFGTASALTFQTAYTMEHDAMLQFKIPTTSGSGGTQNRGLVYVNGILAIQMETTTTFPTTVSLFVRKGSVVKWDATYNSSYGSCFRRYLV